MNPLSVPLHGDIPREAFAAALVLCRVAASVAVLPGLGEASLPMTVRAAVAVVLTWLVVPLVLASAPALPPDAATMATMTIGEIGSGLFLGWLARFAALVLPIAGQLVSIVTGLTSVLQPDPELGAQSSALAKLFMMAVPVALLSSGLYAMPVEALVGSYRILGFGAHFAASDTMTAILGAVASSFALAVRLATPFLVAGTLWMVALGLVSRFVPSLQASNALVPGQILGGLLLLGLLASAVVFGWESGFRSSFLASLGVGGDG